VLDDCTAGESEQQLQSIAHGVSAWNGKAGNMVLPAASSTL
jgi:hypothetical protein